MTVQVGVRVWAALGRTVNDVKADKDKGSVSVLTAFAAAAVLALTVAVLLVGRAAVAAHTARSAADLSALAGAHALREGTDPCTTASGVAEENLAVVVMCTVDGSDVVIRTDVAVDLGLIGSRSASAVARAGPV